MKQLLIILITLPLLTYAADNSHVGRLDNGMDIVLVENHSVPMIAANIIIKVGSRDETWQTWGAAHLLEHLLFNGTGSRTQDEIYEQFDRIGAYHNAHTGSHFTDFMLLTSRDNFISGFDIMADMVFRSTLPVGKFEKERGIVIEEIARSEARGPDRDRPFREALFGGSPLSRAVLGTTESIARLHRNDVLDFYHRNYVPNNMLLFVTGDFSADTLLPLLQERLSDYRPVEMQPRHKIDKPDYEQLNDLGIIIRTTASDEASMGGMPGMPGMGHGAPGGSSSRSITIAYDAPLSGHVDYVKMVMLESILNRRFESDLPGGISSYCGMTLDPDLALFEINIKLTDDAITAETAIEAVDRIIKGITTKPPAKNDIKLIARGYQADQIFNSERLHYYGIMYSSYWALVSWDEFESWGERLGELIPGDVKQAASDWLIGMDRFTLLTQPSGKSTSFDKMAGSSIETFDGTPELIVRHDPSARLFAMHILVKNRSMIEERTGHPGATDLLHRIITERNDKKFNLTDRLDELAATIKTADDSRIPYDNYYTSPEYSFIRFEILPDRWEEGVALVAELMSSVPRDESALISAKSATADAGKSGGSSPSSVGIDRLQELLVNEQMFTKSVYGDVSGIDWKSLNEFRKVCFAAENMIITVSSPVPCSEVAEQIQKQFRRGEFAWTKDKSPAKLHVSPLGDLSLTVRDTVQLGRSQGAVVMGKVILPIDAAERAALIVANSYLSNQMGMIIREKHGLAYSLGSSISMRRHDDRLWGLWTMSTATRPENLIRVEQLTDEIIAEAATHKFSEEEVDKITSGIAGRLMMRSMSRIGQAYSMGVGQFYWEDPESGSKLVDALASVTAEQVESAIAKYLTADNMSVVIVQ